MDARHESLILCAILEAIAISRRATNFPKFTPRIAAKIYVLFNTNYSNTELQFNHTEGNILIILDA